MRKSRPARKILANTSRVLAKSGYAIALTLIIGYTYSAQATASNQGTQKHGLNQSLIASSLPKPSKRPPVRQRRRQTSPPSSKMAKTILQRHNLYRSQVGVPPLSWSTKLERDARNWANYLASLGGNQLIHSDERDGAGENLWMGSSGYFSYTQMVDGWGEEKQYFRNGKFPNVSSTGNWVDVGHYTQMVWRNTTEIGCAIATGGGNDILVCRYGPSGNYMGQRVF